MSRAQNERGQAIVLTVISLAVLLGMTALVLDVGSWFRAKRQLQATADAAALAGAQMLPDTPGSASSTALSYANKNGGGVLAGNITVTATYGADDTINVKAQKNEPGLFSKVLGVSVVDVGADASALVGLPVQAMYVAPMVVNCDHNLIKNCNNGKKLPTFNVQTTLDYNPMGAPGAFGMLNLSGGSGTPGSSEEADWILHGFNQYLPAPAYYRSDPGAKFSSQNIRGALDLRKGTVLLFPVYQTLTGTGQNAQYYVIGWVGFYLQSYVTHGNNSTLTGYFTQYIAQGILSSSGGGGGTTNFGVKSIQLIK
jgi:Flp pilus assembly protein TadG